MYIGSIYSGFLSLAVSFCSYSPFDLDAFWLRACVQWFLVIRLAFRGFILLLNVGALCSFFFLLGLFLFFWFLLFPLLKWLSSELELLSITPFSPPVSFPPAFHYVTPPVPAMHLGNQETESDAEDEVNHTLPTLCCPLR